MPDRARRPTAHSASYAAAARHPGLQQEADRLRAQVLLTWPQEARLLAWLGLRDGRRVLELGSGPGFVTERLLALLPTSTITCVEIDARLIDVAEAYLGQVAPGRWACLEASATETGLPDAGFDFALARFLFQHLPDPLTAAREAYRLLKPGGRLVVIDVDDELWGIADPPRAIEAPILAKVVQAQQAAGGDRRIGRRLWRILRAAGFERLSLDAVVAHSDAVGLEPFFPQLAVERLEPQVAAGVLTAEELELVRASRAEFLGSPDAFLLTLNLVASGQKPDTAPLA